MSDILLKSRWLLGVTLTVVFALSFSAVQAQSVDELKKSIDSKNQEIQQLEAEAKKYRDAIANKQAEAKTLSGELTRIDQALTKLKSDIAITQRQIQKKQLEIQVTALDIIQKEASIAILRDGLAGVLESTQESDQQSILAILLQHNVLSDFFQQVDRAVSVQDTILKSLTTLRTLRHELEVTKANAETKKSELEDLKSALGDQKKVQESQRNDRNTLLQETKNQEKQYAALLQEREARRAALEDEVRQIEAKIKITLDTSILPNRGTGVLGWPLPNIVLAQCRTTFRQDAATNCITQYFGYTSFAAIGAYSGKGHNGTDFRADIGTPVLAAENGEIAGTGDTDTGCRGASYGKWILIKHPDNLSTLYGHLSSIDVLPGQSVARGERIAYSGKTGYATGPHLHFTVFATQAVRIDSIVSRVCGRTMTLPIGALNGYLNPLDYL